MRACRRSGSGLGGALLVAAVVAVLGLVLAGIAHQHLNVAAHLEARLIAENLAESAVSRAIGEILEDPDFGKPGKVGYDQTLEWTDAKYAGSVGRLAFDPDWAESLGIPPSKNNLGSDAPIAGWNRQVPKQAVQLVGTGVCRGVVRRVEVLLYVPSYAHVVASSGPVRTEGQVVLGRTKDLTSLSQGLSADDLLPGSLASNSADPGQAIWLGGDTLVTGDVQAVGGIDVQEGAIVRGELRPGSRAAALPVLDVGSYDPQAQGKPNIEYLSQSSWSGDPLSGYVVRRGDLLVTGDLVLDGCVLFVDGGLDVQGGVTGKGAVFATGPATVFGGGSLSADNLVALAAGGNVTLTGPGKASTFRGLIYTGGDFTASDITLLGNFVANAQSPEGSRMTVRDADLVQEVSRVQFPVKVPAATSSSGPAEAAVSGVRSLSGSWTQLSGQRVDLDPQTRLLGSGSYRVTKKDGTTATVRIEVGVRLDPGGNWSVGPTGSEQPAFCWVRFNGGSLQDLTELKGDLDGNDLLRNGQPRPYGTFLDPAGEPADVSVTYSGPGPGATQDTTPTSETPAQQDLFTLDFNEFLAPADRIRILLWREL